MGAPRPDIGRCVRMAEDRPAFQRTQYAFAAALRAGEASGVPPGVAPERMALYRELIFRNLESFIAAGFPVLHAVLEPDAWEHLIAEFLRGHRSTTPYFSGIPAEFLDFLREERQERAGDLPFLLELAHYEWVELALSLSEEEAPVEDASLFAAPLESPIVLSPLAWALVYRYPVHRIGPDHRPASAPTSPTFLVVYRDRRDQVRFAEINPATYRLLQAVEEEPGLAARVYLTRLAGELQRADVDAVLDFGARMLRELAERSVIGVSVSRPDTAVPG